METNLLKCSLTVVTLEAKVQSQRPQRTVDKSLDWKQPVLKCQFCHTLCDVRQGPYHACNLGALIYKTGITRVLTPQSYED